MNRVRKRNIIGARELESHARARSPSWDGLDCYENCADTIFQLQYIRLTAYSSEIIAGMIDEKNTSQKAKKHEILQPSECGLW
jgi:hypothetical protein